MSRAFWLPVGSVVTLKDGVRPIMVAGCMVQDGKTEAYWEYLGYPYPEGRRDPETDYFFNGDMVREVHQLGMVDGDALRFQRFLRGNQEAFDEMREGGGKA